MIVLEGKAVASYHKEALERKLTKLKEQGRAIGMGILLVGEDKAAHMYARFMERVAKQAGFMVNVIHLPEEASQSQVEEAVQNFNADSEIYGVLPLLPMPKQINVDHILNLLAPEKDIDGLTPTNIGLFNAGKGGFVPCTPRACLAILEYYKIALAGKKVVVLGRSNVVGKPVATMLLAKHATVTICHSQTENLAKELKAADILITAAGQAHIVKKDMVKPGAVVIDVGINDLEGRTVGDVDYEAVKDIVSAITPVPGGVGSVTTTMMLEAICEAYDARDVDC